MRLQSALIAASLAASTHAANDIILNQYQYCIRFFGSLSVDLEIADGVAERNYNDTIMCPRSMSFPTVSGASLDICPPTDSLGSPDNPSTLSAELRFSHTSGELTDPVDDLRLQPQLVTNGSVRGPFQNGGTPAIIAFDEARTAKDGPDTWTINGTQNALIEEPDIEDRTQNIYFGCRYPNSRYYCGTYEDLHSDNGGCWNSQTFLFNMKNALNFTYRFSNNEASVEIWASSEYFLPRREAGTIDGAATGTNTTAYVVFGGTRRVPTVTDYDFWKNTELTYEQEVEDNVRRERMSFVRGVDGLPVLVNETDSGEEYASGNGSYSVQEGGASGYEALSTTSASVLVIGGLIAVAAALL
ncbi:uncharacterized protein AB675_7620 [Cyphellophora attinorum]|uniref:Uncharacterized protein n=1 Tax=Cyphellophora attinorum TaxID=1664694 RepID=A0A0N1H4N2_9EURO|nr:uncharacterized protein AB675_7620 [Phialophora attinorum]KPI40350.1 hypothetical protein AB675_7620 [Phialophora attinorum]